MKTELITVREGFDGKFCYVHSRAGYIESIGKAVMTLQKLNISGMDVFTELESMESTDGIHWSAMTKQDGFKCHTSGNVREIACDFTPKMHSKSGMLLGTGHTVQYDGQKVVPNRERKTSYAVYNAEKGEWGKWQILDLPKIDMFYSTGAGCTQRVDLPNGDILLPHYCKAKESKYYSSCVVKCAFDGEKLTYKEHGNFVCAEKDFRGLYEPSLTMFGGKYFMTMRSDNSGYVAVSDDGVNFGKPVEWTWDNDENLLNYNTQQHWLGVDNKLFLVYTRRGLNNDHVFRHRAPLMIAQVDTENLCLLRNSEQELVPQRGARLGNFGVTQISDNEAWVTVCEWMQPIGCERYGSNNALYVCKVFGCDD